MEQPLPMSLPPLIPHSGFRPGGVAGGVAPPDTADQFPLGGAPGPGPFPGDTPLPRPGSPGNISPNPSNTPGRDEISTRSLLLVVWML